MKYSRLIVPLQYLSFGIIFPFSLLSLLFTIKKKNRRTNPVHLIILSLLFINVLFLTTGRLRLPAVAFLIILAGHGISEFINLFLHPKTNIREVIIKNGVVWLVMLTGILVPRYPFPSPEQFLHVSYYNLGIAETNKGNLKEAEKYYLMALSIYPNYIQAMKNLGLVYAKMNDLERAQKEWEKVLSIDPEYPEVNEFLKNIIIVRNDWVSAIKYYKNEIKINPESWEVWQNLGVALLKTGNRDEALTSFKESLKLNPKNNPSKAYIEQLHKKQGIYN